MVRTKQAARKTSVLNTQSSGIKKKPHRFKPGTRAILDIRREQKSTKTCIAKASFARFAKELLSAEDPQKRFAAAAVEALHQASEDFLIRRLEEANFIALTTANRQTIIPQDLHTSQIIKARDTQTVEGAHASEFSFPNVKKDGTY